MPTSTKAAPPAPTVDMRPPRPADAPHGADGPDRGRCLNCGSPEVQQYCADCGQAVPQASDDDWRVHWRDALAHLTNVDGIALHTLWTLVRHPGALTVHYRAGRRARFLRPLQLFLLANVLYFVAAPRAPILSYSLDRYLTSYPPSPALAGALVRRATARPGAPTPVAYAAAFDTRVDAQRRALVILLAPALAGVLAAASATAARRPAADAGPRRYGEHLVFALHLLTLLSLALATLSGLTLLRGRVLGPLAAVASIAVVLAAPVHTFLAVRRVYRLGPVGGVAAVVGLTATLIVLLLGYRGLLFFATYYTL